MRRISEEGRQVKVGGSAKMDVMMMLWFDAFDF